MPPLLQLEKNSGERDGGWGEKREREKKVSLPRFGADQNIASSWKKMRVEAFYSTCNKLLLVARHSDYGPQKKKIFIVGSVKFANSLPPPSIVKKVRTGSKSSQVA